MRTSLFLFVCLAILTSSTSSAAQTYYNVPVLESFRAAGFAAVGIAVGILGLSVIVSFAFSFSSSYSEATRKLGYGSYILLIGHIQFIAITTLLATDFVENYAAFGRAMGWSLLHLPTPWHSGTDGPDMAEWQRRRLLSTSSYLRGQSAKWDTENMLQSNLFYGALLLAFVTLAQLFAYFVIARTRKSYVIPGFLRYPVAQLWAMYFGYAGLAISCAFTARVSNTASWKWAGAFLLFFFCFVPVILLFIALWWGLRSRRYVQYVPASWRASSSQLQQLSGEQYSIESGQQKKPAKQDGEFVDVYTKTFRSVKSAMSTASKSVKSEAGTVKNQVTLAKVKSSMTVENTKLYFTARRWWGNWEVNNDTESVQISKYYGLSAESFAQTFYIFYDPYCFKKGAFMFGWWDLTKKFLVGCLTGLLVAASDGGSQQEAFAQLGTLIGFWCLELIYICWAFPYRERFLNFFATVVVGGQLLVLSMVLAIARGQKYLPHISLTDVATGVTCVQFIILGLIFFDIVRVQWGMWMAIMRGAKSKTVDFYNWYTNQPKSNPEPAQPVYQSGGTQVRL